jgi:hypothetical protein
MIVIAITMYVGIFFITGQYYSFINEAWINWVFLFVLIIPNALFFIYWAYFMRLEILKILFQRKSYTLFKIFTLNLVDYEEFDIYYKSKVSDEVEEKAPYGYKKYHIELGYK